MSMPPLAPMASPGREVPQRSGSPLSEIVQPKANKEPQGQLAAFLRGRLDLQSDMAGPGKDINRSSSAPPTQVLQNSMDEDLQAQPGDPRADPEYHAYFHANSRLDPRLPPPLYSPGQSWQHWSNASGQTGQRFPEGTSPAEVLASQQGEQLSMQEQAILQQMALHQQQQAILQQQLSQAQAAAAQQQVPGMNPALRAPSPQQPMSKKKNLVDMIQEDFPKTPSQMYSGYRARQGEEDARQLKSVLHHAMEGASKDDSKLAFNRARMSPPPRASSTPPSQLFRNDNRNRTSSSSSLRHTISAEDIEEQDNELMKRLREIDLNDDLFYSHARRLREEGYFGKDMQQELAASGIDRNMLQGMRGYGDLYGDVWDIEERRVLERSLARNGPTQYAGNDVMGSLDNRMASRYALRDDASYLAGMRGRAPGDSYSKSRTTKYSGVPSPIRPRGKIQSDSGLDLSSEPRNPILEEFRASKKRFELSDLAGHVVLFAGDQHGSRFIQQKLETATIEEKQMIFDEIRATALQLMNDVFGNYVIQKFFEHGAPNQRMMLARQMEGHIYQLSLQMYGCRVVQKALEHVGMDQQVSMIRELEGHVMKCVKDQNGNHVIQKAIERVPEREVQFIIEAFNGQVYQLATHPYGCRVIQRIFEHCRDDQVKPLMEEMHKHTVQLIQDQYGNYVIQHILERGKPVDKSMVVGKVRGQVLPLSKHKFASNVIEKCVKNGTKRDRQMLVDEVLLPRPDGTCPLTLMMRDQFANYVVQKMLDCVEDDQRALLVNKIKPQLPALRKVAYGKHLITKVEKYLAEH